MSRFIPGDYVRPINSTPGLPRGSVWVIRRVSASSMVELGAASCGPGCPPSYAKGRSFDDRNLEKVLWVRGLWQAVDTGPISGAATFVANPVADPVQAADKLVEQAAATLGAAKENARKAREEARAAAKAEAAAEAAKKTREAIAGRLHKDRDLAAATDDLIAELSRLHNGGLEQPATHRIAAHVDQLQPLAKSYGYKIAKPGVIAIVIKA